MQQNQRRPTTQFPLRAARGVGCAVFGVDGRGRVLTWNAGAEQLLGYREADVTGASADRFLLTPAPSAQSTEPESLLRHLARAGNQGLGQRLELQALRADGTQIPVEVAFVRIPIDGPPVLTAYVQDISDRIRSEQLRGVRFAVIHQLAQTPDAADPAADILRLVCKHLNWGAGLYWRVAQNAAALECTASWHNPDVPVDALAKLSRYRAPRPGEGLAGRAWSAKRPVWAAGELRDAGVAHATLATGAGLNSAFACAVMAADRIFGVMEFFTQDLLEPDAELLETMETVAGQLGLFLERRRVQNALRMSERELADFFENAAIGLHWVGPDGTILRANRAELDMLGYAEGEYVGHNIADFHADPDVIGDILRRLRAGEKLQDYPARLRCKDGSVLDVLIHSSVLFEEGRFIHTRCFTRDITGHRRAEEKLRESEIRFRSLMEQAPFSVQVFSADGRTIGVNPAWTQLWGITFDQIADYNVLADPQLEAKGILPGLRRAFAGESVTLPAIRYDPEETLPRRSSHADPARWVSAVAYPLKDQSGAVREVVLVHEDRTTQMRADLARRESEEKLRLLVDTIPQLAWMADAQGYIFWYNQRWYEYTGTTAREMEGWGWQAVHDPAVLPEVLTRWKDSIAHGEPFDMVFPLLGADRQFRPFLTRVNPLRDEHGNILYWFGTNTDISDIKRMEQELLDADRRKDEFLATLAHELRNPLAPIRNSLQLLKIPRVDAAMVQQTRDIMERQVDHLVRLVDDLLDVSRVMRGKIELRKEPVELATVFAHATETIQPLLQVKHHRLDISMPDEPLLVDADAVRLAQVLGNLLTNAAKYTESNGHIGLSARREGDQIVVRIRDDGIGIEADLLPHVFELFVQADHAASRSQGGLGIGLTLVKNLVELHGGSVEARSEGPGKGSEFILRLAARDATRETKTETGEASYVPQSSGHRLLVVDDNADAAQSLALLLRLHGHEVRVAHDGASALEVAKAFRPALIFLDIGLPGMDGYEVARQMRQVPELRNTVLAALTGWGQPEDRRRSAQAGIDHHLVKPPDPAELQNVLTQLSR